MNNQININAAETSKALFDAYNQHDVPTMIKLFTENCDISFMPLGDDGKGKVKELGQAIWSQLIDSFPNINAQIVSSKVDAEENIICQVNIKGTQKKDFANIENNGLSFDTDHVFIFKLNDDNLINKMTVTWDHKDLCRQLGQ